MANFTFIYGYIFTTPGYDQHNREVLERFSFDRSDPMPPIFGGPSYGHWRSAISFAMHYKGNPEDCAAWLERFDELLGQLAATSAAVFLEGQEAVEWLEYSYSRMKGEEGVPTADTEWWRSVYRINRGEQVGESKRL